MKHKNLEKLIYDMIGEARIAKDFTYYKKKLEGKKKNFQK